MTHANAQAPVARAPGLIRFPDPIVNRLLAMGLPLGPNVLVTIRGRNTGMPHTQPLAVVPGENGRRWLIGTFGDTNWCRNLRANPGLELRHGRHVERLRARELSRAESEAFFGDELPRVIAHFPLPLRLFGRSFIRLVARDLLSDPRGAAQVHPVFELVTDPSATDRTA